MNRPMEESRFTTSFDGTRIAYRVYGEGSPTVLLSNGIGCNQVYFDYLIRDLRHRHRVITWDYRGHVDSEIPANAKNLTVDCYLEDMLAVMEATETETVVLGGFSMGVQVNFEFFRQHRDRVLGILALCGPYENPLKTFFYVGPIVSQLFPLLLQGARRSPALVGKVWKAILSGPWVLPAGKLFIFNRKAIRRSDFERYQPHIANIDVVTFLQTGAYLSQHSARDVLPTISVPTLVVAGTKDNFTPIFICRRMYEMIPTAEWFPVKAGSHGALIEFPELINERVLVFMEEHF